MGKLVTLVSPTHESPRVFPCSRGAGAAGWHGAGRAHLFREGQAVGALAREIASLGDGEIERDYQTTLRVGVSRRKHSISSTPLSRAHQCEEGAVFARPFIPRGSGRVETPGHTRLFMNRCALFLCLVRGAGVAGCAELWPRPPYTDGVT
jgi:hypothetical protein